MRDDLVLRLQQIGAGGVELFGPEMCAAVGVDELEIDPHLGGARLHRAFQHIAHAQSLPFALASTGLPLYVKAVLRAITKVKGGARYSCQFVGQNVGEIILRRIPRKICEGQGREIGPSERHAEQTDCIAS
jgi:hypothetical protein